MNSEMRARPHTARGVRAESLTQRDVLRTVSSRRAYHGTAFRIPQHSTFLSYPTTNPNDADTNIGPVSLTACDAFGARPSTAPPSFGTTRCRAPNFYLNSVENRTDSFLATMKAMSGNYTSEGVDSYDSRTSHRPRGAFIGHQFAYNLENQRRELNLLNELARYKNPSSGYESSQRFLPAQSSLNPIGGYVMPRSDVDYRLKLPQPHGRSLSETVKPDYYQLAKFVPACVRGPSAGFGTANARMDKDDTRALYANEKAKESITENHIASNIQSQRYQTMDAKVEKLTLKKAAHSQKQLRANQLRQQYREQFLVKSQHSLLRHDADYREAKRQALEAEERRRALQSSWLLVVSLTSRTSAMQTLLVNYQTNEKHQRASLRIQAFALSFMRRHRAKRFLDARKRIRQFFDNKFASQNWYHPKLEVANKESIEIVLVFLQWSLSRRKAQVMTAFHSIEMKVRIIQRAWRNYLAVQRWRLLTQTIQFLQFNESPDMFRGLDEDNDSQGQNSGRQSDKRQSRGSLTVPKQHLRTSSSVNLGDSEMVTAAAQAHSRRVSRLSSTVLSGSSNSRPGTANSHTSTASSGARPGTASSTARKSKDAVVRYVRFLPPAYKQSSITNNYTLDVSLTSQSLVNKWNAMIRFQREAFAERVRNEIAVQRGHQQRQMMESLRTTMRNASHSPRATLEKTTESSFAQSGRLPRPSVCGVSDPRGSMRPLLLSNQQLHAMHRRALVKCHPAALNNELYYHNVSNNTGNCTSVTMQLERLAIVQHCVPYVRYQPSNASGFSMVAGGSRRSSMVRHSVTHPTTDISVNHNHFAYDWRVARHWADVEIVPRIDYDSVEDEAMRNEIILSKQRGSIVDSSRLSLLTQSVLSSPALRAQSAVFIGSQQISPAAGAKRPSIVKSLIAPLTLP